MRARDARQRRRFLAAYDGDAEAAADALFWSDHPAEPSPGGAPSPSAELKDLRIELYKPGVSADTARRYAEAEAHYEQHQKRTAEALRSTLRTPPDRAAARSLVLALSVAAAVAAASITVALTTPAAVPPVTGPGDLAAITTSVLLSGPASDAAHLRSDIAAGLGDRTALVTRSAYADIPVLRRTNRAAGNEDVLTGRATMLLDALEGVRTRRSVAVLLVCNGGMRYSWRLEARRFRGSRLAGPTVPVGHGSGSSCDRGLDAAIVAVPAGWYPLRIRVTAPEGQRYLLSVQIAA